MTKFQLPNEEVAEFFRHWALVIHWSLVIGHWSFHWVIASPVVLMPCSAARDIDRSYRFVGKIPSGPHQWQEGPARFSGRARGRPRICESGSTPLVAEGFPGGHFRRRQISRAGYRHCPENPAAGSALAGHPHYQSARTRAAQETPSGHLS